ncbi:MAG TPA: hypothetical protein VGL62_07270 [Vicinamibacterales bacterium]|jgi:hypothetical protein
MTRTEKRLLILWFAMAFVVWNGVYDMRMHDTVQHYLYENALAQSHLGGGLDMRTWLHRGLVDAVAFSSAWALGVFLAGIATMAAYRRKSTNPS